MKKSCVFRPEFAARDRAKGNWTDRTLAQAFEPIFAQYADRIVIVSGNERVTYRKLVERPDRVALHLLSLGLKPLDRVVAQLPDAPSSSTSSSRSSISARSSSPRSRHLEIDSFVERALAAAYAILERIGDFDFLALAGRLQGPITPRSSTYPCARSCARMKHSRGSRR